MNRRYSRSQPGLIAESYCSECQSTAKPPPCSAAQSSSVRSLALGLPCAEIEIALGRESHVHRREWDLDDAARLVALEVPGPERVGDPGPEAGRVVEPERRVVGEARRLDLRQVAVRVEPQKVIALASDRAGELLEPDLLGGQPCAVVGSRVAAVETDLGRTVEQRLDEPRGGAARTTPRWARRARARDRPSRRRWTTRRSAARRRGCGRSSRRDRFRAPCATASRQGSASRAGRSAPGREARRTSRAQRHPGARSESTSTACRRRG